MPPERGRRSPGPVPHLSFPPEEEEVNTFNRWAKRISEVTFGFPANHAVSHMGGDDDIAGTGTPTTVAFGVEGDAGNADGGFAPFDHQHALDADLEALSGLADMDIDVWQGAHVTDVNVRRLLEHVLVTLLEIEPLLQQEADVVIRSTALPPVAVASLTSSQTLVGPNGHRTGCIVHNASTAILYVRLGPQDASSTAFAYPVGANTTLELPLCGYVGAITGAWASANGSAYITEMVRLH